MFAEVILYSIIQFNTQRIGPSLTDPAPTTFQASQGPSPRDSFKERSTNSQSSGIVRLILSMLTVSTKSHQQKSFSLLPLV